MSHAMIAAWILAGGFTILVIAMTIIDRSQPPRSGTAHSVEGPNSSEVIQTITVDNTDNLEVTIVTGGGGGSAHDEVK